MRNRPMFELLCGSVFRLFYRVIAQAAQALDVTNLYDSLSVLLTFPLYMISTRFCVQFGTGSVQFYIRLLISKGRLFTGFASFTEKLLYRRFNPYEVREPIKSIRRTTSQAFHSIN